jgi:filamentous hemagglutinin family protein
LGQTTQNITLDTDRSVINWNSFDIGQNYTVNFTGPDAVAVLNRVVTVDVSNINGTLMSDPSIAVFLINPNGIIFGNGASVNVGSFIASTLDLDNDDFIAGGILNPDQTPPDTNLYYFFSGNVDTGITVEDGAQVATSSGYLVLLGAYVRVLAGGSVNSAADVGLVAGNEIRVPADPGSPLSFRISEPTPVEEAITIGGQVSGRNVRVFMVTDEDAQNALLNITDSGSITATADGGGDIILTLGAQTSEGGAANSLGGIRNDGDLTATFDVIMHGATTEFATYQPSFVENNGTINAGEDVQMLAREQVTNTGSITAGNDVTLSAMATATANAPATEVSVTNSGQITAGGDVFLSAYLSVSESAFSTETGLAGNVDVTNSGSISAGGDVTLAAYFELSGTATASEIASRPDVQIVNSGTISAGGNVLLNAEAFGSFGETAPLLHITNSGTITADGDADILVDGTIINSGVISVDGVANLDAGDDIDNSGSIAAVGDAILTADGDILDSSGSLSGSVSGADVALSAGGSITAGSVTARDDIAIRAPGTVTTRSLISGATIGSNGPVDVAGAADDLLEGTNLSGHDVDVDGIVIYAGVIRAIGTGSDIRLGAPVSPAISDLDFSAGGDISIDGPASGVDVAMDAGGTITAGDISARDDIALRAGETLDVGELQSGVPIGNLGPVDQAGSADALLGTTLTGHDLFIQASELSRDQATANGTNSDLIMRATTGDLSIDNGLAGGNVDLGAAQLVTVGTVVAQAGDVIILADDLDILGSISGSQVSITNRSGGKTVTVVGDASAAGAFTLTEAEINRINSDVLNIDSLDQNMLVGNIAFDNDVGSTRIGLLGTARIDVIGEVDASGVTRTLQIGGTAGTGDPNDASTLASIIRIAPMSSGGGRIILGGGSLDLRGVKIGVGLDDGFLQQLGLVAGGTPASNEVVQDDWIGNLNSTLYGIPGGYADPIVISAGSITVTYTDYALFQNTGTISSPSGVNADQLSIVSSGNDGNSFELFGTIDEVEGRGAALLVEPTDVSLATSRVNGCLIVTGGGCGSGSPTDNSRDPADFNPTAPPEPPNGEFSSSALGGAGGEFAEQELVSTDDDQAFEFDSLVGTNNEGLLGVLGVDDAEAPEQCAPDDKRPLCRNEEKPDAQ